MASTVQELCAQGQDLLLATEYLQAERLLVQAEQTALCARDWDCLSRLYMPLQECRRQIRQRCGEGLIKLDYVAQTDSQKIDPQEILKHQQQGQVLVAGFGTIEVAIQLRRLVREQLSYIDVYLAASYWINGSVAIAVVPNENAKLPEAGEYSIDELTRRLPAHSLLIPFSELPKGELIGNSSTFALTMSIWEKLHLPFLALADQTKDLERRIHTYRDTIAVDYACELAHQRLSDAARSLLHSTR